MVAAVFIAGSVVVTAGPASASPAISVAPDTNLADGDTATIAGSGWATGSIVQLYQCHDSVIPGSPINEHPCEAPRASAFTDGLGAFTAPFTIRQHLIASNNAGTAYDCSVAPGCLVVAYNGLASVASPIGVLDTAPAPATITGTVRDEAGVVYSNGGALACPGSTPAVYGCPGMIFTIGTGNYTLNGLAAATQYSVLGFARVGDPLFGAYFGAPPVTLTTTGPGGTTSGVDFVFDSTLSGTVTGPDGVTPVASAEVRLVQPTGGGQIATTDASGHFASPLVPSGQFTIEVVPPAASGLGRATRVVTIPTNSDVVVDVQLGLGVEFHATILDGGNPVAFGGGFGLCTFPGSGPGCPGLLFDGVDGSGTATISGVAPGTYNVAGFITTGGLSVTPNVVVTAAAGDVITCTFTFNPTTQSCTGGSADTDGVSDGVEDGAPNGGDGNSDGALDSVQANVTSLPNAITGGYVTVASPNGTTLVNVAASPVPGSAPPLPAGTSAPVGLVNFVVRGVGPGGSADVTVFLPPGTAPNSYLKLHAGAWVDFTANTTITGDQVTLHLVDGGAGDSDGVANGEIVDPGAPTRRVVVATSKDGCKQDGWRGLVDDRGRSFANQGDCVSFVATKGKNKAKG